jgi:hypothetical protein
MVLGLLSCSARDIQRQPTAAAWAPSPCLRGQTLGCGFLLKPLGPVMAMS